MGAAITGPAFAPANCRWAPASCSATAASAPFISRFLGDLARHARCSRSGEGKSMNILHIAITGLVFAWVVALLVCAALVLLMSYRTVRFVILSCRTLASNEAGPPQAR